MKTVTIELWISEDGTEPVPDRHGRISPEALAQYIGAMNGKLQDSEILTSKGITDRANGIAAREYHATVQGIVDDLARAIKDGEITDSEELDTNLHETIDGHHNVIYTYAARQVLAQSDNDGAYFDNYGTDGAVEDGAINWSRLAYAALMADVQEAIGDPETFIEEHKPEELEDENGKS